MQPETIKNRIENHLPEATVEVNGADGQHFEAIVVAKQFIGKNRVQQQQMVYASINDLIQQGELHALSLKTYTPEEWQTLKNPL